MRLTGEYTFVDKIGNDAKWLYIPILEVEKGTFNFLEVIKKATCMIMP